MPFDPKPSPSSKKGSKLKELPDLSLRPHLVEGFLLIVGGAEDRECQKVILRKFVELAGESQARILVISLASGTPEVAYAAYQELFLSLGACEVRGLTAKTREEVMRIDAAGLLDGITGIYITGGDQLRISTILGGTAFQNLIAQRVRGGCCLGGTSAGASAISDAMIIDWIPSDQPLADNVRLSPGLGILREMIIDQHFTQRNRLNRLITAVAYHPGYLGIGIDEDTAALVAPDGSLQVIGSGTVTIVDATDVSFCNVTEVPPDHPFSIVGLKMHVLSGEKGFRLQDRSPYDVGES